MPTRPKTTLNQWTGRVIRAAIYSAECLAAWGLYERGEWIRILVQLHLSLGRKIPIFPLLRRRKDWKWTVPLASTANSEIFVWKGQRREWIKGKESWREPSSRSPILLKYMVWPTLPWDLSSSKIEMGGGHTHSSGWIFIVVGFGESHMWYDIYIHALPSKWSQDAITPVQMCVAYVVCPKVGQKLVSALSHGKGLIFVLRDG